jgi:hypothetical protein
MHQYGCVRCAGAGCTQKRSSELRSTRPRSRCEINSVHSKERCPIAWPHGPSADWPPLLLSCSTYSICVALIRGTLEHDCHAGHGRKCSGPWQRSIATPSWRVAVSDRGAPRRNCWTGANCGCFLAGLHSAFTCVDPMLVHWAAYATIALPRSHQISCTPTAQTRQLRCALLIKARRGAAAGHAGGATLAAIASLVLAA